MQNIEAIIDQHKRRSIIINNLVIDWQYLVELAPQVFNKSAKNSANFNDACCALHKICNRTEDSLKAFREIIPTEDAG